MWVGVMGDRQVVLFSSGFGSGLRTVPRNIVPITYAARQRHSHSSRHHTVARVSHTSSLKAAIPRKGDRSQVSIKHSRHGHFSRKEKREKVHTVPWAPSVLRLLLPPARRPVFLGSLCRADLLDSTSCGHPPQFRMADAGPARAGAHTTGDTDPGQCLPLAEQNYGSSNTNNPDRDATVFEVELVPRNTTSNAPIAPFTDKLWAVAFLVNVCFTVITAVQLGSSTPQDGEGSRRRLQYGGGVNPLWVSVGIITLVTWGFGWVTLHLVVTAYPVGSLQMMYAGFIGLMALETTAALRSGNMPVAAVSAVACALCLRYVLRHQSSICFGAANLKVAVLALKSKPRVLWCALFIGFVQIVWLALSAVAAVWSNTALATVIAADGTSYPASECWSRHEYIKQQQYTQYSCHCGAKVVSDEHLCTYHYQGAWLPCFWLLSFAWGVAVLGKVASATVTGSAVSWWFDPGSARAGAVQGAFCGGVGFSFGSLCKAAAITPVARLVTYPVRWLKCLQRLLRVQGAAGYGLPYVTCFLSIYGLSFSEALGRVDELLRRRGLAVVANDDAALLALFLLFLVVAVCLVAALKAAFFGFDLDLGFWVFFLVPIAGPFWTILEVVRSSYKATFILFVQHPDALQANHHGRVFDDLSEAWQHMSVEFPEMVSGDPLHTQV